MEPASAVFEEAPAQAAATTKTAAVLAGADRVPAEPPATKAETQVRAEAAPLEPIPVGERVAEDAIPGVYLVGATTGYLLVQLGADGVAKSALGEGRYEFDDTDHFRIAPADVDRGSMDVEERPGNLRQGLKLRVDIAGVASKVPEGFTVTTETAPRVVYRFVRVQPLTSPRQIDGKWEMLNQVTWKPDATEARSYLWLLAPDGSIFHLRCGRQVKGHAVRRDSVWSCRYLGDLEGTTGSYTDPYAPDDRYNIQFSDGLMVRTRIGPDRSGQRSYTVYKRTIMPPTGMPVNDGPVDLWGPYLLRGPGGTFPVMVVDRKEGRIDAIFAQGRCASSINGDMYLQMGEGAILRGVSFKNAWGYHMLVDGQENWRGPQDEQTALLTLHPLKDLGALRGPRVLTLSASFPPGGKPVFQKGKGMAGMLDSKGVMTWQNGRRQQLLNNLRGDSGGYTIIVANRQQDYIAYATLGYEYLVVCQVDYADKWLSYRIFCDPRSFKDGKPAI